MRLTLTGLCALSLALLACIPAIAQDAQPAQWGLGLGAALERQPYRGVDDKTLVLPQLLYESRWVSGLGTRLDLKLPPAGPVSFRLRAKYLAEGYEAEDAPQLQGMAQRKASVWLGGVVQVTTGLATVSLEALSDASDHSRGSRVQIGIERAFNAGAFQWIPRLAMHRLDRKYVDYYFGVRPGEERPDRAFHDGRATTNFELGLRTDYTMAPRHHLSLDLSATRLGHGITDSPLVARRYLAGLRAGYLYLF